MGISDNAQRVSSPPIQREASHPSSNAVSRTSVRLQSHCLPKPLTWEIQPKALWHMQGKDADHREASGVSGSMRGRWTKGAATFMSVYNSFKGMLPKAIALPHREQQCDPNHSPQSDSAHAPETKSTGTHWQSDSSKYIHRTPASRTHPFLHSSCLAFPAFTLEARPPRLSKYLGWKR